MKKHFNPILFCTVRTIDGHVEIWEGADASEVFENLWDARTRKHEWTMPADLEDGRVIVYQMAHVISFEFEPEKEAAAATD